MEISLAFPIRDHQRAYLWAALVSAGVTPTGEIVRGDEQWSRTHQVILCDQTLPVTVLAIEEDGFVSVSVDVPADEYDAVANRAGRRPAFDALLEIAGTLLRELDLTYVFVEEGAEVSVGPTEWSNHHLSGVTLVPRSGGDSATFAELEGVLRVEGLGSAWLVLKQLDPVPHHAAAWPPTEAS